MKTASTPRAPEYGHTPLCLTVYSEAVMMARLGGDLRDLYGDLTGEAQPDRLMQLAALVDRHRAERDR